MNNAQQKRADEYVICQQRGHQPNNVTLTTNPPLSVCKWCGAWYRYAEAELIEISIPGGTTEEP